MRSSTRALCLSLALMILMAAALPAAAKGTPYQTGYTSWSAANGFDGFTFAGTTTSEGRLALDPAKWDSQTDPYAPGTYNGGNYYNGGTFFVGEATSPFVTPGFAFSEAIASWNADTPDGSWVEVQMRAQFGARWTKWYSMGIWASGTSSIQRHSVKLQGDADGYVSVDTLVLTAKKAAPTALQLKVRLFSANGAALPTVSRLAVAYSTTAPKKITASKGNSTLWDTVLNVPECSQMVYPDGGNVWCSPTSTSMVLGYWGIDPGPCEPRVRAAVSGVYDWLYDGHGNWPFNTAYAASHGMAASVARFTSLDQVEPWIAAGVPVVISFAWNKGDLTGSAIPSSNGHLAVIVGFDKDGNPIVNDPAAATDDDVQRKYNRGELESVWLIASGGTVYLIYPPGADVPGL